MVNTATVLPALPGAQDIEGIVRMQRPVAYPYFEEIRDRSGLFASVVTSSSTFDG